ncbi:MAG: helicase-exonuclease AddAB subunit AddA [Clostridia bacterium]|nr:helicase-exonuclease AddAB subunit AddA [Clostridia bacterium]
MSKRVWTAKQEQSITATDGSVLVSAAAGSGKTAVLVERVIRRITHPTAPVDVDRLLIVTFTRAAAAEMRQRLSNALVAKMAEEPENRLYQRQQMLLSQANISTIHGFCTRLLQEHAAQAGLPVGFKVAEETQAKVLAEEALDTVLEENYRRKDGAFIALANQLNSHKSDSGLREAVLHAYDFMQAQPFPAQWLRQQLDAYTAVVPLEKSLWMGPILQELDMLLESACLRAEKAVSLASVEGLEPYQDALRLECNRLHELRERLSDLSYDELYRAVDGFAFERLAAVRAKDAVALDCKEQIQNLRKITKKKMEQAAALFCGTEEECREDLAQMAPLVEALGRLVEQYQKTYTALKRQQKLLDYGDLEQETLRLLLDSETHRPTPLAVSLSAHFAEIVVDEYQDTNAAQDALFFALSRGGNNLFMVGDVKQSIYGFRQAMPEIFTSRRDSYPPYDPAVATYPATITMENNFRSRRQVTDTVNFLFRQLMQRRLGGVEYADGEELVCSAAYSEGADCRAEWLLLDMQQGEEDLTPEQAESHLIARKIRQLLDAATVEEDGVSRPMQWRDICVLFRTRKAMGRFAAEFNRLGIPTAAEAGGGLLAAAEIRTVVSLLRVIDNPLREVELSAVMLSPLYGFTPDEMGLLRLSAGRHTPLYTAVENYSHPEEGREANLCARCAVLLTDLRRYRTLAVSVPADRLLELVYRESGLEAVYAARSGGRQRVANLHRLDQVARSFEQGGFRGLSAFVRYIDRLEEQGKDLPGGSTQRQDGVQMMTVHGSKGLEFPVVFLARLGGKNNNDDARCKLLFHATAGIGLRLRDDEAQEKHTTLPFVGVQSARRLDSAAEELRVWYVALTRARERLFMVYTAKDISKVLAARGAELPDGEQLLPDTVLRATCVGDPLLTAALRHPAFAPLRAVPCRSLPSEQNWWVETCAPASLTAAMVSSATVEADEGLAAALRQRFGYVYPYEALQSVPAKLAASQLSHESMSRDHIAVSRPAFLQKEGLTAAQKGTALHTFMQYADLTRAAADLEGETARLAENGFITEAQRNALPTDKIRTFLAGPLFARMAAAQTVWREYPFTVPVMADTLASLPAAMGQETVVVQGIADCVFREGDGLVLVDYKTDRVKTAEELTARYRSQLLFYKQALEQLLCLPVKEMLLYSFALDRAVAVTEEAAQ